MERGIILDCRRAFPARPKWIDISPGWTGTNLEEASNLTSFASPEEHLLIQSSPAQKVPQAFVYGLGHWCLLYGQHTNQINGLCLSNPAGERAHTHKKSEWSVFLLRGPENQRGSITRQALLRWLICASKPGAGGLGEKIFRLSYSGQGRFYEKNVGYELSLPGCGNFERYQKKKKREGRDSKAIIRTSDCGPDHLTLTGKGLKTKNPALNLPSPLLIISQREISRPEF